MGNIAEAKRVLYLSRDPHHSVNACSLYQYVVIIAHHVAFDALPTRCMCDVMWL